jgi:hypothetical protein
MIIKVYAETSGYAESIATFESEELYNQCLPAIEQWAADNNFTNVTESIEDGSSKFPNGFTSWMETFYEMTSSITMELAKEPHIGLLVAKRYEEQGHGGMYELAQELTDEFERLYAGRQWDGDFFDAIQDFIETKL